MGGRTFQQPLQSWGFDFADKMGECPNGGIDYKRGAQWFYILVHVIISYQRHVFCKAVYQDTFDYKAVYQNTFNYKAVFSKHLWPPSMKKPIPQFSCLINQTISSNSFW